MGRYYSGDINGKFWFGIQSSAAPERFGAIQRNVVNYSVDDSQIDEIQSELDLIKETLGIKLEILNKFFEQHNGYTDKQMANLGITNNDLSEYADYELGIQILNYVKENGYCEFEAEL